MNKYNNVTIKTISQPEPLPSGEEQLRAAVRRKGIPDITLPADKNGYAYIDKEKYPELYNWAKYG